MTDEMQPAQEPAPEPMRDVEAPPESAAGGDVPGAPPAAEETGSAQAREWLAQLQHMIDRVAAEAGPVARDVAVKAAELAAVAGEKAGPFARRAAEVTGDVGSRVAERSRRFADDMRHRAAEGGAPPPAAPDAEPPGDAPATGEEPPA